jgi:hypothetical protein
VAAATTRSSGTGYFLVSRAAFAVLRSPGRRRLHRLRRVQERARRGQERGGVLVGEGGRAAPRPLPGRGGRADGIRVNTVNPDAVLQGSRIWGSSWREERAAAYGIEPDELEEHYRKRTTLGVNILPEDIAEAVLHFASSGARARAPATCSTSTAGVPAAYPR